LTLALAGRTKFYARLLRHRLAKNVFHSHTQNYHLMPTRKY